MINLPILPAFSTHASCAEYDPDLWFPEERRSNARDRYDYSYTPEAIVARTVCSNCDAYDECLDYAVQFKNMEGIWANHDRYERAEEQRRRGMSEDELIDASITCVPMNVTSSTREDIDEWE